MLQQPGASGDTMGNKSQWMALSAYATKNELEILHTRLRGDGLSIADLFDLSRTELYDEFGFTDRILCAFENAVEHYEDIQEKYSEMLAAGIETLFFFEDLYPQKLKPLPDAPSVLYCLGDPSLLSSGGVALLAPAEISLKGEAIARRSVQQLAGHHSHIIAGLTRHSGTLIHAAALQHGSSTSAILPCGILQFTLAERLRPYFDPEHFCIASPFTPDAAASAENAVFRNTLIATLADAVYIIECSNGSILEECAAFCTRQQIPLFLSKYSEYSAESSANQRLIEELGAHPIQGRKSGNTIEPNIDPILAVLRLQAKRTM